MTYRRPAYLVYLAGAVIFGLAYAWLKVQFGSGWLFLGFGLVYFLALRVSGELVERFFMNRKSRRSQSSNGT